MADGGEIAHIILKSISYVMTAFFFKVAQGAAIFLKIRIQIRDIKNMFEAGKAIRGENLKLNAQRGVMVFSVKVNVAAAML